MLYNLLLFIRDDSNLLHLISTVFIFLVMYMVALGICDIINNIIIAVYIIIEHYCILIFPHITKYILYVKLLSSLFSCLFLAFYF